MSAVFNYAFRGILICIMNSSVRKFQLSFNHLVFSKMKWWNNVHIYKVLVCRNSKPLKNTTDKNK